MYALPVFAALLVMGGTVAPAGPLRAISALAQDGTAVSASVHDPFADFETHRLGNGMKVWLRVLPGAADVSVGVSVPYGADMDPPGREQLAHFTEHMLFSDHRGLSEEEIKDQVESRGGTRNGFTTADHTFYYVTLPAEHGLFGLDWLSRILEPHAMDAAVVERNRRPVALEIGARPPEVLDHLQRWLDPTWLHRPDFWRREFGLATAAGRRYDPWSSLQAIAPQDLRDFYDRYYAPEGMTLVIVGDVDRGATLKMAEERFGSLGPRPVPEAYGPLLDPGRADRFVIWTSRPDIRYRRIFKIYDLDRDAHLRLLFLARYLDRRLTARLRFGETKAVYGVGTQLVRRGPASYLLIDAPVDADQWDFARGVIEEELRALADGATPPERFRADREAVVARLVAANREPQDLVFWAYHSFYDPALHAGFPDLPAVFASYDVDDMAAFVRARLRPEREIVSLRRPQPISRTWLALLATALVVLTFRVVGRSLTRPVEMRRIRYVARLRLSPLIVAVGGSAYVLGAIVAGRLLAAAGERIWYAWIFPVDLYAFQLLAWAATAVAALSLAILYLSLPPRKLLVFPDHVRVKHLFYRSREIPLEELRRVRRARVFDLIRDGTLWRTLPLSLGLTARGVHLEPRSGMGYLFRVRRPGELLGVMSELGIGIDGAPAMEQTHVSGDAGP
jgi:predicted Zn-dependent peptidase